MYRADQPPERRSGSWPIDISGVRPRDEPPAGD
jgi:hypothetical protein